MRTSLGGGKRTSRFYIISCLISAVKHPLPGWLIKEFGLAENNIPDSEIPGQIPRSVQENSELRYFRGTKLPNQY